MRFLVVLPLVGALIAGCSSPRTATYVRDTDTVGLDTPAMSTGLDRRDLERVFVEARADLERSAFWEVVDDERSYPTLAILPIRNETSEHVDRQLDALLSRMEADLVGRSPFDLVSLERQPDMVEQVRREQADAYDPAFASRWGRQLGADYVLTGKVHDAAERTDDMRRVQYFLFLQVVEVETSRLVWSTNAAVTKALMAVR
ncbi:MAG: penicillin-binding protein activator LpoB [Myxococcota bacterium]